MTDQELAEIEARAIHPAFSTPADVRALAAEVRRLWGLLPRTGDGFPMGLGSVVWCDMEDAEGARWWEKCVVTGVRRGRNGDRFDAKDCREMEWAMEDAPTSRARAIDPTKEAPRG